MNAHCKRTVTEIRTKEQIEQCYCSTVSYIFTGNDIKRLYRILEHNRYAHKNKTFSKDIPVKSQKKMACSLIRI